MRVSYFLKFSYNNLKEHFNQIIRGKQIFKTIRRDIKQLLMQPTYKVIEINKSNQRRNFNLLKNEFLQIYYSLRKYEINKFIEQQWTENIKQLKDTLLSEPSFSFLKNPLIQSTMFLTIGGKWLRKQLKYLRKKVPKEDLKRLLMEDYVGEPYLLNSKYLTSHNTINHLYHIIRFLDWTNCNLKEINTIIEWGGGYGNMAKIFKKFNYCDKSTYIIIDLPFISCIQWLYLATILGKENVKIIKNLNDTIKKEKINILPVCFLEQYDLKADLFISTWALSESSKYSQDFVADHNWFNSKNILLLYQKYSNHYPNTIRIEKLAKEFGFFIETIDFLPSLRYAFR